MFLHALTACKLSLSSFCITPLRYLHGPMATNRSGIGFVVANAEDAAFQPFIIAAAVKLHTFLAMQL